MATQSEIDTLTATVQAQTQKLQTIDTEVKALAAANPTLDISALQAAIAAQGTEVNTIQTDTGTANPTT